LGEGTKKIGDGIHGTPLYDDCGKTAFINGNNLVNGQISITEQTKFVNETQKTVHDRGLNNNTILMSINGTIGNLAWYKGENIMLGKSAAYLEVDSFSKTFMYSLLQTNHVEKYFLDNLTGTTIKNLGLKTIRETPVIVPCKSEQTSIGHFFRTLDDAILFHKHKCICLKKLKKGYLQQMFPQEGECIPKVRFKGFTGDWVERKLEEIFDYASSKHTANGFDNVPDGYPLFDANKQIGNIRTFDQETSYISIIKDGAGVGRIEKRPGKSSIIATMGYLSSSIADIDFCFTLLETIDFANFISGTTIPHIYFKDYGQKILCIPSIIEQIAIGNFFRNLDNQITDQQAKLDKLKLLKSAYLQKMFV